MQDSAVSASRFITVCKCIWSVHRSPDSTASFSTALLRLSINLVRGPEHEPEPETTFQLADLFLNNIRAINYVNYV